MFAPILSADRYEDSILLLLSNSLGCALKTLPAVLSRNGIDANIPRITYHEATSMDLPAFDSQFHEVFAALTEHGNYYRKLSALVKQSV